jgi:crotonobetaine/carnitine-CoA ligase
VRALAGAFQRRGVKKGDRVAIVLPNRIEMVWSLLAAAEIGAVSVPVNPFLKGSSLQYPLTDSGASLLVTDREGMLCLENAWADLPAVNTVFLVQDENATASDAATGESGKVRRFADMMKEGECPTDEDISPADPVAIIYTSGTTGAPKGCVFSNGYATISARDWVENGWIRSDDVIFSAYPMFHTAGFNYMLVNALNIGAAVCIEPTFSARNFMKRVREEQATAVFGVGPMGMAILATEPTSGDFNPRLRVVSWIPMNPESQRSFEVRFGGTVISGGIAQTEASAITKLTPDDAAAHPTSLGRPCSYIEVAIVDDGDNRLGPNEVGELVVRPREPLAIFSGYWNKPEATLEAGRNLWHHTGDYCKYDTDGYYYFVDRKKDVIRRRGENISSFSIEQLLLKYPGVVSAAVHGVPSPLGEDDIKLCLVLSDRGAFDIAKVFEYCCNNLPYFAVPRYVELMDSFPLGPTGRVAKNELRQRGLGDAWDFEAHGLTIDRSKRRTLL